jgi:hypothetical protein
MVEIIITTLPLMVQVVVAEQPLLDLMEILLQVVMEVQEQQQVLMVHPQLLLVVEEDLHMEALIQLEQVELVVEEMEQDKIIQLEPQVQLILVVVVEVVKEMYLTHLDSQGVQELSLLGINFNS